jgi:hypothetical protein
MGQWWTKWDWGRLSASTMVSPANSQSTNCSTFINHPIIEDQVSMLTALLSKRTVYIAFIKHTPANTYKYPQSQLCLLL